MVGRDNDGTSCSAPRFWTWGTLAIALVLSVATWIAVPAAAFGQAAPVYTQAAHSGGFFGATSTTSAGGGAYEDVSLRTTPGDVVCASAWVRTQYPSTGAAGSFAVWLRGGGASDVGERAYSALGNLGDWSQGQACAEATSDHTGLRVQFYPAPGSPTVDLDDVDVDQSLAVDGGFENGGGWAKYPGTKSNFVDYGPSSGAAAHSGSHFGATNKASGGGGIYQDVSTDTSAGQVVCGSAWVRTEGAATGAKGSFVVWLTGGTSEAGQAAYSGLGNGAPWTELQTCVEATQSHTGGRIQFYPAAGSPTVEIDDVDGHQSLAVDGGFEDHGVGWHMYPGTHTNFTQYAGGAGAPAHSGGHFGATNTSSPGGGIYQDVSLSTSPGQMVCGSAWARTEGAATGDSGS